MALLDRCGAAPSADAGAGSGLGLGLGVGRGCVLDFSLLRLEALTRAALCAPPRVDVPVPMPPASDIKPGKVVYVRYTAVPEEHRPTAALRRLARGIVTSWPGDWSRGMIRVEWDYDPGELWPAEWLADAPEWV